MTKRSLLSEQIRNLNTNSTTRRPEALSSTSNVILKFLVKLKIFGILWGFNIQ